MSDWSDEEPASAPQFRASESGGARQKTWSDNNDRGHGRGRAKRDQHNDSNGSWRDRNDRGSNQNGRFAPRNEWSRNGANDRRQQAEGNTKVISIPSQKVGRIIGKGGSKIKDLQYESEAKINVGNSNGADTDITICGSDDAIAKAQSMIEKLVEDRPVSESKAPVYHDKRVNKSECYNIAEGCTTVTSDGNEIVDWQEVNKRYEQAQQERWDSLPPIIKDFYIEDKNVASMPSQEVAQWRKANNDIQVKRLDVSKEDEQLRPVPNPVTNFEQAFRHYPEILEEIRKQGFERPSPIQCQAWPILLRGDDMIGIAQTGTGKTLAFLLPALIHIDKQTLPRNERKGPTVLIMAPTRELALQIEREVSKYQYKNIKSVCLYGGGDRREQINAVKNGVDIVIATPGRLNDLVQSRHVEVINFSYIVLDEADRMLDMGFEPQIRISLFDVRPDRQTVMTSATWPPGVRRLADSYMKNPIQVNVGSLDLAAVHTVTQEFEFVAEDDKDDIIMDYLQNLGPDDRVIVFCGRKATARHIYTELACKGIACQAIHSDRDQSDREAALEDMTDGSVNILIATDVASRGIDIKDLTHVINLDFPRHIEEYVHRIGRTGRAGRTGTALSFITREDWANASELIKILEEANQHVPNELVDMAQRFEAMKLKKASEGGGGGRGRGRGGRGGRGGGRRGDYGFF